MSAARAGAEIAIFAVIAFNAMTYVVWGETPTVRLLALVTLLACCWVYQRRGQA